MATQLAKQSKPTPPTTVGFQLPQARMGRPPIAKEIYDQVLERLAEGEPLAKICTDPAMPSFRTFWQRHLDDEEFSHLSARAREIGTHKMADDCLNISDRNDLKPHDKRIMIDTRLRLIGQWNRAVYGAHSRTEITGKDGGAIEISDNSAKLQELAQTLRQAKRSAPAIEGEVIRKEGKPKPRIDAPVPRVEHAPEDISDLI